MLNCVKCGLRRFNSRCILQDGLHEVNVRLTNIGTSDRSQSSQVDGTIAADDTERFGGDLSLPIVGRMIVMRACNILLTRNLAKYLIASIFSVSIVLALVVAVSAEDGADNAHNMLENLKRRSAEERWQRIKRLYPSEPPAIRYNTPAKIPENQVQGATDNLVPPSPEESQLIPRMAILPRDTSNDWILTARPSEVDASDVVPAPDADLMDEVISKEITPSIATRRVAAQDVESKPANEDQPVPTGPRNVLSRKISDINPFYDRNRDTDIREFAQEKSKEYEGEFKPSPVTVRSFPQVSMEWEASNLSYYPLYFSDPALERTGHTYHPVIQPFASIARFGTQLAFLPYQMTIEPICTEVSPLGWYRPGECAPKLHYQVPLNAQAAAVEAACVAGLYFVIP